MIVCPPRPKFSLKWQINQCYMPAQWLPWIENAIVWSLSQEKRYRDMFIDLSIMGVNKTRMKKLVAKFNSEYIKNEKLKSYDDQIDIIDKYNQQENALLFKIDDLFIVEKIDYENNSKKKILYLGKIFSSSALIYERWVECKEMQKNNSLKMDNRAFKYNVSLENNFFLFLVTEFVRASLCLLNVPEREKLSLRRNILAKFGIYLI